MEKRRTLRNICLAGIFVSLGFAGVAYRMNTGAPGTDRGRTWCLVIFGLLEYISFQYLLYCTAYTCPGPGKEGQEECLNRCLIRFVIIQLLIIIFLLSCFLMTNPW